MEDKEKFIGEQVEEAKNQIESFCRSRMISLHFDLIMVFSELLRVILRKTIHTYSDIQEEKIREDERKRIFSKLYDLTK